jgi:hypothetical protein
VLHPDDAPVRLADAPRPRDPVPPVEHDALVVADLHLDAP